MYQDFRILLRQCYAQMEISFPGLIFAQYKSINIIILLLLILKYSTMKITMTTQLTVKGKVLRDSVLQKSKVV